jgi:hypothetical protein
MKARLYLDIRFSKRATDAESLAAALDNVIAVGMAQLSDCWGDYGGKPKVGKFLVLDTEQAAEHAEALDALVVRDFLDEKRNNLRTMLAPVRDFLRQVAGKE